MNKKTIDRIVYMVIGLLLIMLVSSCTGTSSPGFTNPVIKLVVNPWTSSELNAAVAKIILEEKMGYPTELVEMDEYSMWEALAKGEAHAALEVWPSGHLDDLRVYVDEQQSIENGGPLGPVGKINWYIPSYMLRDNPELATWKGLQNPENAALFDGEFILGDSSWTSYDEAIIHTLGLNLKVVVAGSEDAVLKQLDAAYQAQEPILFYFWTPHWAHVLYDLSPVSLPPYREGCHAEGDDQTCEYPSEQVLKIYWAGLKNYAPDAYDFLTRFTYKNVDQITMLSIVNLDNKTVDEAARLWVDEQERIWRGWIPER